MDYKREQEAMFQELDARDKAAKTAWVGAFIRAAQDRDYSIDDLLAVLDEPGMTSGEAIKRILGGKNSR